MFPRPVILYAAAAAALAASTAHADIVLYQNNFENGADSHWTNQTTTNANTFTRFLGRFGGTDAVALVLTAPPPPGDDTGTGGGGSGGGTGGGGGGGGGGGPSYNLFTLSFDFYCIDSWDGDDTTHGPDHFIVWTQGTTAFNYTFANQHTFQSYPHQPDVGPAAIGFNTAYNDSIYRHITIPFTMGNISNIQIVWGSQLNQSMTDESWGIDNVQITYAVVPAPGSVALLGIAGMIAGRRKR